ncbi:hypothetical protein N7520_005187 [Penicillium odoratum]|uniref:uncharacterized protein n=1 Tax=Penicillium odoratum TaxID=1167516 RepID=UPI002549B324|nr:uncharacterized protein N7520_005187 [Penicillium odoratum]KAJ5765628.1 hypothetical protein N7520_005187 [Penicillium odoratum]
MEIHTCRNNTIPSDTNPCHICTESLAKFDDEPNSAESKRRMRLLFHGTCSNEDDSEQQSLCAFCHHLRLEHLLGCLEDGK